MSIYSTVVLADTPIRYYKLNETSGTTAIDSGSQGQNGTLNGTVTLNQKKMAAGLGASMLFDGSTGYISLSTTSLPTGASAWSMEAWVNPGTLSSNFSTVMGFGTKSGQGWAGLYSNTTPAWTLSSWTADVVAATTPTPVVGTTYHLVATYDGTTAKVYVNGTAATPATWAFSIVAGIANIATDATDPKFSGNISDVAWYSVALSQSRITAHYQAGIAGLRLSDGTGGVFS